MAGASPLRAAAKRLLLVLVSPLLLALFALLLALWLLCTVTGLGPLLQHLYSKRDRKLLEACLSPSPGAVVKLWTVPSAGGRKLAVRWTEGRDAALPPVCIPNGLGATLVTIGALHDRLEARGYPVLSYDRAGVGFSDPLPRGSPPATPREVVADMRALMDAHVPVGGRGPWVLVGPSAGSVIGQCYAAAHPEDVAGFLNMDGFPYPFAAKRDKFLRASSTYKAAAAVVWTGFLRPLLAGASKQLLPLATPTFPLSVVRAQMNQPNFFASLAREMTTMMDCATSALVSWGPGFDLSALPPCELAALANARPEKCGDIAEEGSLKWTEMARSEAEIGDYWTSPDEAREVLASMLERSGKPLPVLPTLWRQLVVRVMSARDFDFGAASSFYDREMRQWAAAEHSLHALLARDGRRAAFPKRNHNNMFFALTHFIAAQVDEIAAVLAKPQLQGRSVAERE